MNPLRWPIRVARAGLFLAEEAVAGEPARGSQLSWIAENLLALVGVQVELVGNIPVGVLVLPTASLVPAAAILACVPVDAVGPSLARLPGLGHAAVATTLTSAGRTLLTWEDGALLHDLRPSTPRPVHPERGRRPAVSGDALRSGRPGTPPISVVTIDGLGRDQPPGFLRAAARPITHLRVRIDAVAMRAHAA